MKKKTSLIKRIRSFIISPKMRKIVNNILLLIIVLLIKPCRDFIMYVKIALYNWCNDISNFLNNVIYGDYSMKYKIMMIFVVLLIFIIILCCILYHPMIFCYKWKKDKEFRNKKGNNKLDIALINYINSEKTESCFLLTGLSGSGKTFQVNRFFDENLQFTNRKIIRISCFGLSTRNEVINEINKAIEDNDTSFFSDTITLIGKIPVLGELFTSLYKKKYSYMKLDSNSIVVLDDFERVKIGTLADEKEDIYQRDSFIKDAESNNVNLNIAVQNIDNDLRNLNYQNRRIYEENRDNSYVAISGLVNELVEVKGSKVIIICNKERLTNKYINTVLREKLSCIEFVKNSDEISKKNVVDGIMKKIQFEDKTVEDTIRNFLAEIVSNKGINWPIEYTNLRNFKRLVISFIDTVLNYKMEKQDKSFLYSVFNSKMILQILDMYDKDDEIKDFETGLGIAFLLKYYKIDFSLDKLVLSNSSIEEIKWVGKEIAADSLLLNVGGCNIDDVIQKIHDCEKFTKTEKLLLNNVEEMVRNKDLCYRIEHILYYEDVYGRYNSGFLYSREFNNCFTELRDNRKLDVYGVLLKINNYSLPLTDTPFWILLYEKLVKMSDVEKVKEVTKFHKIYNECVLSKGKEEKVLLNNIREIINRYK